METQLNLKDIQGVIRRRYKIGLLMFIFIFMISIVIALVLPPKYKSSAMIMIEEQQIPTEYVKSTITSYAEERLQMITRQIMKYSQLRNIIEQLDLYAEMVDKDDMASAVEELKKSVNLETVSFREGKKASTVAFSLSYEGDNPKTVKKVTEALSQLYVKEEYKAREKLVAVTADFFKQELDALKAQVEVHEDRMREFKSEHLGALPENSAFNLQNVSRLEMELERSRSQVRALEDRKIYLKGQLANVEPLKPVTTSQGKVASNPKNRLKRLRLELIQMQARLSDKHPDIRKIKSEIERLEGQVGYSDDAVEKIKLLDAKRARLAELKGRLSEKHPDVIKMTKEVNRLSVQVDKLVTDRSMVEISEEQPDNPAYINLMTQVAAAEFEIKSLKQKEDRIMDNLSNFRTKLSKAPMIEQEYNTILLDLNNAKQKYQEILNNLTSAQVAQQMEKQQKGEKFTILEHAFLPTRPFKPNRIAIVLFGFIIAVGTTVTIAAIMEAMDHSLKNEEELSTISNLPVFSSISLVQTPQEHQRKRLKYMFCTVGVIGVCLIILAVANRIAPFKEF
jgi:uncharacterized protein involved in exopolysaccharide biosynthesis